MANEVEIIVKARDQSAPGIDSALRRIERLKTEAQSIHDAKVNVKVDAAEAAAEIRKVKAEEASVRDIHVKVHVDEAKAGAEIDKLKRKLHDLKDKALSPLITSALALGPALLPVMGSAITVTGSLTGSLLSAGAALGVFGGVLASAFGEVRTAAAKTSALQDKIRLLNQEIKLAPAGSKLQTAAMTAQAKATLELHARLALLPPATRNVVTAFGSMKSAWHAFVDANKGEAFGFLTRAFDLAREIIPKLQPLFHAGALAMGSLMTVFERKLKDGGIQRLIDWLGQHALKALNDTIRVFAGLAKTIANFVQATNDGGGALHWLANLTDRMAEFTKGKAFTDFLAWVHSNGGQVGETLVTIAKAAVQIAKAVTPLAPVSLALAKALAAIIAAIPAPVLTAVVAGLVAYSVAVRAIAGAQKVWAAGTAIVTAAQWALDAAMTANPIGVVIVAIAALVAVLIYAYKHSTTFRNIVNAVGGAIKNAAVAVMHFTIVLIGYVGKAVAFVIDKFGDMATFVGGVLSHIPGMGAAGRALQNLGASAHAAAQKVRDVANAMAGVRSKSVSLTVRHIDLFSTKPQFGPGIGPGPWRAMGGIIGHAAEGGPRSNRTVVGENGPEVVDLAPGSTVHSAPDSQRMLGGAGGDARVVIELRSGGSGLDDLLLQILRKSIRVQGGNVQTVLGT